MANHKSALKRVKQNKKRYARNKSYRTRLKNAVKRARLAINSQNVQDLQEELKKAQKIIHKIKSKGVIHKNKAARLVSRLAKAANKKLQQSSAS
ncbi:MAG: 30S ribosomal protein S20 [Desulfurella sp.]|uniref:Small ribosomal subunit protein bS20 n=1 Tax=Desulfurella multipotens TaxID=79269 RepID=A0A1G6NXJ1_9BACT|nr:MULTISPECIES: 30S ribosomal protein S20 [Desulfurella]AHF96599.1 30S ribosomal protein S20 [Desulfurella acetivorans A63]PMP87250.1 MAG: 30S ribosomal protein S20 [Desulfurella sp.]SDC71885.1 small subunit ribosomal protein S20 [Desulfurella multipotens]HEX14183.1 30S ribosomal protein S20 [Desulfurella acetivorans]